MSKINLVDELRELVSVVYERIDSVDELITTAAIYSGGAVETVKQVLVNADKWLAEQDKTETVRLGDALADRNELTEQEKLTALADAADEHFGVDRHLWRKIGVGEYPPGVIDDAYNRLKAGTLFTETDLYEGQ